MPIKRTPVVLTLVVLLIICGVRLLFEHLHSRWGDQLERITYDLRARMALKFPAPAATNLAFIAMEDSSIAQVKTNDFLNFKYGLYWPRLIYGHVIEELAAQGAKAVAFDVLFAELRHDHPMVALTDGSYAESDEFFAREARVAGNVLIAATPEITPPPLFATNVLALADVSTDKDPDGTLRRVKAFYVVRHWHPLFLKAQADPDFAFDLDRAEVKPGKIIIPQTGTTNRVEIPVDAENNFELADFIGDTLPPGMAPKARAFTDDRRWQMGIQLAAQELQLDLKNAVVDLPHGRITLRGAKGVERVVPVDADGYFYVNWRLTPDDHRLTQAPVEKILLQDMHRLLGHTNGLRDDFRDKLIIFGSTAQGNDLSDRGATPLENDTFLLSTYWNVANSVITGQFIQRTSLAVELGLICFLGLMVAGLTWRMRRQIVYASVAVVGLILAYIAVTFFAFVVWRWWLPIVFPVAGAMVMEHGMMIIYLVIVEDREKRRIKSVFSKMVSPDVVNELLAAEHISMVGSRREVTVLFADIRGFTTLTDEMQDGAVEFARTHNLDPEAAEKCFDDSARETLETVNSYLTKVADAVIAHRGTLDKYIGDCVMAFWGAPLGNERHAADCVRAAVDAQRAIFQLNQSRLAENIAREAENRARAAAGLPPKAPLRALQLGTGINTGTVIVGLMGSGEQKNYTTFGREVNLASRLEGVSGSGRIIISEITHQHLQRHDPVLGATCVELPSVTVKGIRTAVRIFEVPWKQTTETPAVEQDFPKK